MLLEILVQNCYWFLIGCLWPIIFFISIGISIFCAKKKPLNESKTPSKVTSSVKKNNNDSEKPNQSSQIEAPPKKEKSKSKSKHLDSKQKKSMKKDPTPKVHAEGKTDPFEADGDDQEEGGGAGKDRTETSQKCPSKSKKRGGKGKLGLPNKDGYDDLNPNKKDDEEAKSKMKTEETKSKMQNKDDGYDAIDPTKNVNLENVNMNDGNAPSPGGKKKPKLIPRDAKQEKIAKGAKKGKGDYPTFDDVISDWDSKKEGVGDSPTGGAGGAAGGGAIGDKSKVKPSRAGKKSTVTEDASDKEEKFQLKSPVRTEKTQPSNNNNNDNKT